MNGKQKEGGVVSFFENTRKPAGLGGKIMVAMMNFGHSAMAEWGLHFLQPAPDAMVLDCGCGGGANIFFVFRYTLGLPQAPGLAGGPDYV